MKRWLIFLLPLLLAQPAAAQKYPERSDVRAGNRAFEKGSYEESTLYYLRALDKTPGSAEAAGNLAGALYRQGAFEESAKLSEAVARDSSSAKYASQLFYNAGNAHVQQRKLDEAIEAYKNALRRNPYDQEAKFNLAYAQALRDKNQNDGGGGGGDDNQDNQDNQDQNNQDNQDQNDDQNDQDQDNQDGEGDPEEDDPNDQDDQNGEQDPQEGDGGQPPPPSITPQQAEQMLNAMQEADDKTKEKVDARAAKSVGASGKNW